MPPLTILSGANETYYRSLGQLAKSLFRQPEAHAYRLRLYDLGLRPEQRRAFDRAFCRYPQIEWRTFPFERYPAYFRPEAGTYAWKPALIGEAFEEVQGSVLWLDSATLVLGSLQPVVAWLETAGTYVPMSGTSTLQALTHPATLAHLNVPPALLNRRQRGTGICGFNYHFPLVRALVREWQQAARRPDWLAPAGASLMNHRFEQSLLTILLYQYEQRYGLSLTADEQDVSSANPVSFLSVRNKVWNGVPLGLDFAVWRLFWCWRRLEVFWIRSGMKDRWKRWGRRLHSSWRWLA